jgi:hypothetical protein
MNICYDVLFVVNFQLVRFNSKNMYIDISINNLGGLITYLKNYRGVDLH